MSAHTYCNLYCTKLFKINIQTLDKEAQVKAILHTMTLSIPKIYKSVITTMSDKVHKHEEPNHQYPLFAQVADFKPETFKETL